MFLWPLRTPLDLIPIFLFTTAALAWWSAKPKNIRLNLIASAGVLLFCWAVAPEFSHEVSAWFYTSVTSTVAAVRLDIAIFAVLNWRMLLTGAAIVWLGRRAWQTLWKPVPELISILGVEVPDAPYVVLAGIRPDAATLNWTRPAPNRPVQKFLIQVNGVNVGEVGANQEPAIVVSGLKPDHFYNVRVIAVGSNNFQAGSQVVRLRTYGKDGRPQLGNGRLPTNFRDDEQHGPGQGDHVQENGGPRSPIPALEATASTDGNAPLTREGSISGTGARRNTVSRRHSPSTTSMDQPLPREDRFRQSEQSLPELTEKFESIRKEIEDTMSLIAKEEADNERLMGDLELEKAERKREKERKESQTDGLKKEVNSTDREMRKALANKTSLEKKVKEKQDERNKIRDGIASFERLSREMREGMEGFDQQKKELEEDRDERVERLRLSNEALLEECSQMEAELKEKREQVKDLEDARKKLPGGEDEARYREKDHEIRKMWQGKHRLLQDRFFQLQRASKNLDERLRVLGMQVQHIPSQNFGLYSQGNSSGLDLENAALSQLKRRSRTSNSLSNVSVSSPLPPYSQIDPATLPAPTGFSSSRAANGTQVFPFLDLSSDMPPRLDEAGLKLTSAPLSPSATALLPSNILDDFDDDDGPNPISDEIIFDPFTGEQLVGTPEKEAQSPASSARSISMLPSPHESTHNLPRQNSAGDDAESTSLNAPGGLPSPVAGESSTHRLAHLFSFQRARGAKGADDTGPALGSLKHGQSQSFPRQTDEAEVTKRKWTVFNRSSAGPEVLEAAAPNPRMFKNLIPFSSQRANSLYSDRDPSSPRPASIASSEFPRPSTDSGSIWGPLDVHPNRFWSPDTWSRDPSRRPSIHGSPSALKTTLASETDEILKEEALPDVSQVGVIGSRIPVSSKSFARLNPNAPAFMSLFKSSKVEKDREGKEKEKDAKEVRDASKDKDKTKSKDKSRNRDATKPETPRASIEIESPSDSRVSRDTVSVHTQTSVSESHESLSLDMSLSNTPSEPLGTALSSSAKDENVVRKLFRKGSSGKFSLPGRLGGKDSGLFKKGPGSIANSDKGVSVDRSSIGDVEEAHFGVVDESGAVLLGRSYDSVASSPSLGATSSTAGLSNGGSVKGGKEGKTSVRWLSNFSKKGRKEKESLDLDRDRISESDAIASPE